MRMMRRVVVVAEEGVEVVYGSVSVGSWRQRERVGILMSQAVRVRLVWCVRRSSDRYNPVPSYPPPHSDFLPTVSVVLSWHISSDHNAMKIVAAVAVAKLVVAATGNDSVGVL